MVIQKLSPIPICEQIVVQMKRDILKGTYRPSERVPSVREISSELAINPNTVQRAYAELTKQGYLKISVGNGNFVAPDAAALLLADATKQLNQMRPIFEDMRDAGMPRTQIDDLVSTVYAAT